MKATIGMDIGGTQLRVAVFDENFAQIDAFRTQNVPGRPAAENLAPLVDFIRARGEDIRGIGVGCPGPLDARAGRILNPPNLFGWDDFEIVAHLEAETGLKTVLNNDGNIAALAEARLGAGRDYESVAYVGVSTGIGGGYVYRGQLLNGAHSGAAEWWNMIVNEDTHAHKNAQPGSLNEQCSGSGLAWAASQRYGVEMNAAELFRRYGLGEANAVDIITHAADALGRGFANIMCVLDPEVVVVGGSVARYNPFYVDLAAEKARGYMAMPETLRIKRAQFGDDAGLVGAAMLVE